ncbi:hypothetical protein BOTBODRAFT_184771 [Botryobasidium botryosum FD-172 SS1]|uniref:BTB domain-containing protein n=1 Tax=Botryobasidium botryosum (strain FD-172 SS1) TaxID=930990 RepID=A0A067MTP4_BOTB1|nr:hypothetical protein BOTBODRAFT_184771 [Botryobasidium botryosum FD-172 SS1]
MLSISSSEKHSPPEYSRPVRLRHETYYLRDGNLVICVDNILFNVHRYFFVQHSPLFAELLSLSYKEGYVNMGDSEEAPLHLTEVSMEEFLDLLSIFYPPSLFHAPTRTVESWRRLLSLSKRLQFADIFDAAVAALDCSDMDSIQRLQLARQYNIREWRFRGFLDLSLRRRPLTVAEGKTLGGADTVRACLARESVHAHLKGRLKAFSWRCTSTSFICHCEGNMLRVLKEVILLPVDPTTPSTTVLQDLKAGATSARVDRMGDKIYGICRYCAETFDEQVAHTLDMVVIHALVRKALEMNE